MNVTQQLEQLEATCNAALDRKDAEIERLREKISKQDMEIFGFNLERTDMKSLVIRAADALEETRRLSGFTFNKSLIDELRKAAQ